MVVSFRKFSGQFGFPKFHLGLFIGMAVIFLANAVEAIGGYDVLAELSEEKPPPSYVINRSIFFEGKGSSEAYALVARQNLSRPMFL